MPVTSLCLQQLLPACWWYRPTMLQLCNVVNLRMFAKCYTTVKIHGLRIILAWEWEFSYFRISTPFEIDIPPTRRHGFMINTEANPRSRKTHAINQHSDRESVRLPSTRSEPTGSLIVKASHFDGISWMCRHFAGQQPQLRGLLVTLLRAPLPSTVTLQQRKKTRFYFVHSLHFSKAQRYPQVMCGPFCSQFFSSQMYF